MGWFSRKPPEKKNDEKNEAVKPPVARQFKKPEPDIIETYFTTTVFGRIKLSTEYFAENKRLKLIFSGITELPGCVKTILPHNEGGVVDGIYRINLNRRQSASSIVTDAKGNSHIDKSLHVPVKEFVPLYLMTTEEKEELAGILKWMEEKNGVHFEIAKLLSIEGFEIKEKLRKAKLLFKGAKVRQDFDIAEFSKRVKEILQAGDGKTFVLAVQSRLDQGREDSFMLIESGKPSTENPEHLLKVENLIDLGAQFAGMERAHLVVMAQKSIVIECEDGSALIIMPIAKQENNGR